jgi:hypothetical protein
MGGFLSSINFFPPVWSVIERFLMWCGSAVEDGRSHRPSVKRVGLMMAVTGAVMVIVAFGGAAAGLVIANWYTTQNVEVLRIITTSMEIMSGIVFSAVTTGYLGGKAIERKPPSLPPADPQ